MIVLIGSHAMQYHLPVVREPVDRDIVGTYDDIQNLVKKMKARGEKIIANYPINSGKTIFIKTSNMIVEAEVAWEGSRAEKLIEFVKNDPGTVVDAAGSGDVIAGLNLLYALKMSHRYLKDSPHFIKTMNDIHYMRENGATIPKYMQEFYEQRMKDTYDYTHPKLNTTKGEFFNNETNIYTLDHDSIHEAVKHLNRPAYEYFKADIAEVMCSKDKFFFSCDEHVRLLSGLEETYVLSIERAIHPYPHTDRKRAFDTALMKLCTSISSGWFREFCWENYHKIQALYDVKYVDKFYDALHNGRIKPFSEAM